MSSALRGIPAAHRLLTDPSVSGYLASLGSANVKAAVDVALADARAHARDAAAPPPFDVILAGVLARLVRLEHEGLLDVLNATGILLHTNLGRAPLAPEALDALHRIGSGYSNLEFDLESGERGSRHARLSALLTSVTGAEDGLVVNNCAAAVLLILDTFAKGREVVVSRNQLVEIGAGFRIPDVLERSGAKLVEVGTTNKVYARDFERALGIETALLLRTHPSNYRIEGFTADVAPRDLVALGRRTGLPVVEDLGSGALIDLAAYGIAHERTVGEAVADGIDLIAFSGDKLLGGPQAGIVVGRAAMIARMRANPLLRALRTDKSTLAALAATLRLYLEPAGVVRIPFYAMLSAPVDELERRAQRLSEMLQSQAATVAPVGTTAYVGAGALPLDRVPSFGIAITPETIGPNAFAAALRRARSPLIGRCEGRSVILDLRTIPPDRDGDVAAIVRAALPA